MATNQSARIVDQVVAAAFAAGFRGTALQNFVAIAMAESRGKIDVRGDISLANSTWGASVGLWQVRSLHNQRGTGRERDHDRLSDPLFNARAAWTISNGGTNLRPWSVTHGTPSTNNNHYSKWLGTAADAIRRMVDNKTGRLNTYGQQVTQRLSNRQYIVGSVSSNQAASSGAQYQDALLRQARSPETVIRYGARGEHVTALQKALTKAGFSVPATGYYGSLTQKAVRDFQKKRGLLVDSIAGPATLSALGLLTASNNPNTTRGAGGNPDDWVMLPGAGGTGGMDIMGGALGGIGGGIEGIASQRPLTPEELREFIANTYPQMLWALDDKELGPLLKQAAEEGWSAGRMYGALIQTNWWKNNPESTRALQNIIHNDPATWRQMNDAKQAEIRGIYKELGISVPKAKRIELQRKALLEGWNAAQLTEALVQAWTPSAKDLRDGKVGGRAAQAWEAVADLSNAYILPMGERTRLGWVKHLVSGNRDPQALENRLRQIAMVNMPWLADSIKQGLTPAEALSAHRQQIAQVLEIDEQEVNFKSSRWQRLLTRADKSGKQQLVSSADTRELVRTLMPTEWGQTNGARSIAASMVQSLAESFGRRA